MTYTGPVYKSRIGAAVDFSVDFLKKRWKEGDLVDKLTVSVFTPISLPVMTVAYYIILKPEVHGRGDKSTQDQTAETS